MNNKPLLSVWSPQHRRLTIGLILLIIGPAFDWLAVATILPKVMADLGGLSAYGWALSAYMLAMMVGLMLAGEAVDHQGPALPFTCGIALFTCGLVLTGTASSMITFVLSRGVQGVGVGILTSVAYFCLGRGYPEQVKPHMIALVSSTWVVPALLGPALSGLVAEVVGWRWVFLGLVPELLLAIMVVLPSLQTLAASTTARSWDWHRLLATMGVVMGTAMVLIGIQVPSLPLALLLLLAGWAIGLPSLARLFPAGMLQAKAGLPAAVATLGLLSLAFYGAEAFVPLTLIAIRGQATLTAGLVLTAASLAWTAGSWMQARLAARQGRRLLVLGGLLLLAIGLMGITGVLLPGIPVVVAFVAWSMSGLGMGLAYSTINLVVLETAPAQQVGWATASAELAGMLGSALGTGLGGVIIGSSAATGQAAGSGIAIVDLLVIAITGLSLLTALRLPGRPFHSGETRMTTGALPLDG
jgi:MFS family permease